MNLKASVVLVTRNRQDMLKKTIKAVLFQTEKNFELIIVDDGSTDGTSEFVKSIKDKRVRGIVQNHSGLAEGRNNGIRNAKSDIVAFIDDDELPEKEWLSNLISKFKGGVVGVEGKIVTGPRELFSSAPENLHGGAYIGGNMAFKKSALLSIGLYDKRYAYPWRDDSDIAIRMQNKGNIVFSEKAVVYHPILKRRYFREIETLKFYKNDFLLLKKFGCSALKVVKKDFFKDFLNTAYFLVLIYVTINAFYLFSLMGGAVFALRLFRFKFAPIKYLAFFLLSGVRGLLFPFAFLYYFLKVFLLAK